MRPGNVPRLPVIKAEELTDEIADDDGPFAGQRMHLHHRVFGLEHGRFEDVLVRCTCGVVGLGRVIVKRVERP